MTKHANSGDAQVDTIASQLGIVINGLYESGDHEIPGEIHLQDLNKWFPAEGRTAKSPLWGALVLLHTLGLITIRSDGIIRVVSKQARFALGSISRFLKARVQVVDGPDLDELEVRYLSEFTRGLETIRYGSHQKIDRKPLHSRRIVNVIIKGQQLRNWVYRDVYLHVYHPKWKAYHLIGLGQRHDGETDDALAQKAMKIKMGLREMDYEFDLNLRPSQVIHDAISGPHGALTNYTIVARVAKSFSGELERHLRNFVKSKHGNNQNPFRWFTLEEIRQGLSDREEEIMASTSLVLQKDILEHIPISAGKVRSVNSSASIWGELGNRFSWKRAAGYVFALASSYLLFFHSDAVISALDTPSQSLQNLGNVCEFLGIVIAILSLFDGFRFGLRR